MRSGRGAVASTVWAGLACVVVGGLFGCEGGPGPTSASRDSLGVRIVESVAPSWGVGAGWVIEEEPVVDLVETGSGDMHLFLGVRDLLRTDDHLVVADGLSRQIRVYGADGFFLRAFGGPGEGPGEFSFLAELALMDNGRLVAQDYAPGGGGAEFDLESGLVGTFSRPQMVYPLSQVVPSQAIWGSDERVILGDDRSSQGLRRPLMTVVRLSPDRASSDPIVSIPGDEVIFVPDADAIPIMGRRTHAVPTGDGGLVIGTADAMEYSRVEARSGRVELIARIIGVSLEVSRDEAEREKQVRLGPRASPRVREIYADISVPDRKPAYQQMLVDAEGNVWAGEFLGLARRDEPQDWYVWDSSGVWLGVVETPARFELMRVGESEVFGVRRDVDDVEHPQVLRLVKP